MHICVRKSDDEGDSPTSACLLDTATTEPLWPARPPSSHDQGSEVDNTDDCVALDQLAPGTQSCMPPRRDRSSACRFDPCRRDQFRYMGREIMLQIMLYAGSPFDPGFIGVLAGVLMRCKHLDGGDGLQRCESSNIAGRAACAHEGTISDVDQPSPTPPLWLHRTSQHRDRCARRSSRSDTQHPSPEPCSFKQGLPAADEQLQQATPDDCTFDLTEHLRGSPDDFLFYARSSGESGSITTRFRTGTFRCGDGLLVASTSDVQLDVQFDDYTADCPSPLLSDGFQACARDDDDPGANSNSSIQSLLTSRPNATHNGATTAAGTAGASTYQPAFLRHAPDPSALGAEAPASASALPPYDVSSAAPLPSDEPDHGPSDDPGAESAAPTASADVRTCQALPAAPALQTGAALQVAAALAAREQHPDVPLRSVPGRPPSLLAHLDQHLLDRVLLKVAAGGTGGALNAAAATCRRLRHAVCRIAGSAGPPTIEGAPPVDSTTAALDIRALHSFPSLHTLRLPKLDRGAPMLPVDLFRLRTLTLLTHLDVACAAAVPSFQPLRLLPNLRKLSVSGVSLAPPPDIPDIPECEVTLYANRALAAATRGSVLSPLPPLSGLRIASRVPFALLQQIGSSRATRGLTYLRLGCCNMPQLAPLSALTCLARLHLHMLRGQVGPLAPLTQLTYLHLHGSVEDLPQSLSSFRRLQKLSLIKCRRLRPDEVRAIGTLSELTSLELPHGKAMHALRDVRPLSRLHSLQHLSLAMPEAGIAPLVGLSTLTFLRLKCRTPNSDVRQPVSSAPLAAGLFTAQLVACNATAAMRGASGMMSARCPAPVNAAAASVASSAMTAAVALAGAAAVPLAVYAARRAWRAIVPAGAANAVEPPGGRLGDLAQMQQLEWLEVKSSTLPTSAEWTAALAPLTRLRRLDVRNTAFSDATALRDMAHLSVLLVAGCDGVARSDRVLRAQGGLGPGAEIRW
eukprot:jgi/Ulvmu1/8124/UM040_0019.1